jgi:hypothetical protein
MMWEKAIVAYLNVLCLQEEETTEHLETQVSGLDMKQGCWKPFPNIQRLALVTLFTRFLLLYNGLSRFVPFHHLIEAEVRHRLSGKIVLLNLFFKDT